MSFLKQRLLIISIFFFATVHVIGQERLTSVLSNPVQKKYSRPPVAKTGGPGILELPFLDDFSGSAVVTDVRKWTDSKAYINNNLCHNPPSFQVATLDMMDSTGMIYPHATVRPFFADTLSSQPINLFLPQDTTIYLSFYYQPQGLGDAPEPEDSLVLEFYAPSSKKWLRAWSSPGTAVTDFKLAMVNISDSRFLQEGFRFRFRNLASLSPSYEPSLKVNADHWNLDYVYLNRNRHFNDTILPDLALIKPVGSLVVNYTAMPWEHFRAVGIAGIKTFFQIQLKNLSLDRRGYQPVFTVESVYDPSSRFQINLVADEVKALETLKYDATFNYGFTSPERDSARFNITLNLNQTSPDLLPGNDLVTSQQVFTNYYAYDDGSAEAGYGLVGEGTKAAKVAYRYHNLNPGDSLMAVSIYFNRSFADAGKKYFQLAIWADNNNKPGALIHMQEGALPAHNGINEFQTIKLDTAQVVPESYYVGWIQTTADFLNVGFDRQNIHREDILYNLSGTWQTSSFDGSLMIRPVFANKSRKSGFDQLNRITVPENQARIYPNPANDYVSIENPADPENTRITLITLEGRVMRNIRTSSVVSQLNVENLPGGIYLIVVQTGSSVITRQKIMILHE